MTNFHENRIGCFEIFSPEDGYSKITKKNWHPVQPNKNIFFAKFKNSSDRIDLNLYCDMKKNNCKIIIDGNRAVEKLWLFLPLFGYTERVTPVNWPKKTLKVIRSFLKLTCHHFIAKWGSPHIWRKSERWGILSVHLVWNELYRRNKSIRFAWPESHRRNSTMMNTKPLDRIYEKQIQFSVKTVFQSESVI